MTRLNITVSRFSHMKSLRTVETILSTSSLKCRLSKDEASVYPAGL
ncbi:MAG: hypothetical protein QXS04_04420 [Thermoproteota archaeon]